MSWACDVTDELVRLRGAGVKHFSVAWSYAIAEFPPRRMDSGPRQLSIDSDECLVDFLHRRAELEWDGLVIDDFAGGLRSLLVTDVAGVRPTTHLIA